MFHGGRVSNSPRVNLPARNGWADGGQYVDAGTGANGRADNIPAQLSENEYIIDAETVALLGDGNPDKGAAMLDEMRRNIRQHKGQALVQGEISENALPPLEYCDGGQTPGAMMLAGGGRASKLARAIATYRIPLIRTVEDHIPRWTEPEFMREDAFEAAASKPFSRKELVLNIKELLEEAGLDPKLSRRIKATGAPNFLEFDSGNISHAGAHHEVDVEGPEDIINKLKAMLEGTDEDPQMALGLGAPLKKAEGGRVGAMKALMQRITGGYRDAAPTPAVDNNIDDLMAEADRYLQELRRKPRRQRTPDEQRDLQQWGYGDEE